MITLKSLQKFETKNPPPIEIMGQGKTQLKPCNDEAFIAVEAVSGLSVLYVLDEVNGNAKWVVSNELLKFVKRNKVYSADIHITKTEAGDIATHIMSHRTKNSWVLSFKPLLKAAEQSPVAMERDSDAELYIPVTCTVDHIDELTQTEIDEALNATFGDFVIEDVNHPALEGLLKVKPKKVEAPKIKKAPVEPDSDELILDLSVLDEDDSELLLNDEPQKDVDDRTDAYESEHNDLHINLDELALDPED